jgi:hypothetical protein
MIDKKYIELMNKEIDKVITEDEKISLHSYLSGNNEAKEYFNELQLINDYLDKLPDNEPSENLKKQIINSIDFSKYSPTGKVKSFWSYLFVPKLKIAYSFATGLIAGIILIVVLLNNYNSVDKIREISGTIGIDNSNLKTIEEIPLKLSDLSGKITLIKTDDRFLIDATFDTNQNLGFMITYPSNVEFQNIDPGLVSDIQFSKGDNFIKAINSGFQQYKVSFTKIDNNVPSVIHIQLLQAGNFVYDHDLRLN